MCAPLVVKISGCAMNYNEAGQVVEIQSDSVKFVTVLDLHLSPVTPASRKDDFLESTVDSFRQAIRFATRVGAQGILLAGDVFHLKTASRNPTWFQRRAIALMKEAKKQGLLVLGIAGNHDLTFGSLTSLESQPIGVLVEADVFHLLDDKSVLFKTPEFTVRVAGCSYNHAQASPVRDLKKGGGDEYLVALGHFWFGKETGEFFGEPVYGPAFFKDSEVDVFVIGHHHADQGIPVVGNQTFFAHGSINRIGAHAGDLERRPAVGLLEVTKDGVKGQVARLKVPDAKDIFDVVKQKAIVEERKELEEFMNLISNQVVAGVDVESILGELKLVPEVRKRCDKYLSDAEEKAGTA